MKKTLLLSALAFTILANAQNKGAVLSSPKLPKHNLAAIPKNSHSYKASSKKTTAAMSEWYNFVDFLELVSPGVAVGDFMHVFPDSTIVLGLDNTNNPVYPFIHKAAQYMDPSFFGYASVANKFTTYKLDSIYIGYAYLRKSAPSIKDSIIIQVIAENHALDYTTGTPGYPYQDIEYNMSTNNIKSTTPVLKRIGVELTEADSSSQYNRIYVPVVGVASQTNSKKIGVVISFKPGYTYSFNDTLLEGNTPVNTFFLASFEQNGPNTDPTIFGTANDYTTNMNMSMLLATDSRYNISSNGWNGYFIPTYAYTTPFRFETHDIGYKLSVADVGLEELAFKGFSLEQNSPNPFANSSTVFYELAKDARNVSFSIIDVTGRVISSEKVSSTLGKHSISLTKHAAGVYYYSLTVDGVSTTKKMIVE